MDKPISLFAWFGTGLFIILLPEVYGDAQRLQCYACGLPKVHPEFDVEGSYGQKIYNHSCEELMDTMTKDGKVDERFIRTCPDGVKSCFGATGSYDHQDNDPDNDIWIRFFGCSEAKHKHDFGCDKDKQNVDVKDKSDKKIQVEIDVKLCFCSQHLCQHPHGDLMQSSTAKASRQNSILSSVIILPTIILIIFLTKL